MTKHEPDPLSEINKIQVELDLFGIKLLPPHITKSKMDFHIEGENIRYGLVSIKGISDKTIEKLNNFRERVYNGEDFRMLATFLRSESRIEDVALS